MAILIRVWDEDWRRRREMKLEENARKDWERDLQAHVEKIFTPLNFDLRSTNNHKENSIITIQNSVEQYGLNYPFLSLIG